MATKSREIFMPSTPYEVIPKADIYLGFLEEVYLKNCVVSVRGFQ